MSLADKKTDGGGFSNQSELVRVIYDFAVDGGTVKDYDMFEASNTCVIELAYANVITAVTSGGSLLMDVGKGDGGVEIFDDKAVAALTLDSIHKADDPVALELAAGEKIVMGIEGAAATAGKVEFVFRVYKR